MQTADWQINEVNIFVKCSNRFPIHKPDFYKTSSLGIRNVLLLFDTLFDFISVIIFIFYLSRLQNRFSKKRQLK